ncbi:MAG: hypothetical protein AAB214_14155, partial [Fibrobacterota bacterium]
ANVEIWKRATSLGGVESHLGPLFVLVAVFAAFVALGLAAAEDAAATGQTSPATKRRAKGILGNFMCVFSMSAIATGYLLQQTSVERESKRLPLAVYT